jgi:hypothetical protein
MLRLFWQEGHLIPIWGKRSARAAQSLDCGHGFAALGVKPIAAPSQFPGGREEDD